MNITSPIRRTILTLGAISLMAVPAFAQTSAAATSGAAAPTTSTTAKSGRLTPAQRLQALGARGDQEVTTRIDSLNKLISRIQGLKNVSDTQKNSIVSTIQGLITDMNTLKTNIDSDNASSTMKSDVQSITKDYRIYALAIPQLNILAASDRIVTIVGMMEQISTKLTLRLQSATGVPNISALQSSLNDLNSKVADANSQAQAAVAEVSPLVPDQGDKTVMASNTSTMKDARAKIKTAVSDLTAARKDALTIIQGLVKYDKSAMATDNGSTAGSATPVSTATSTGTTTQ